MSKEQTTEQEQELVALKARADLLKIQYHPKIGLNNLRKRVAEVLEAEVKEPEKATELSNIEEDKVAKPRPNAGQRNYMTEEEYGKNARNSSRRTAGALVRVRITCMNPNKSELEGELISVGSARLGTFKKFVAFNTEEGYHIPKIMFDHLKQCKCSVFHTTKDDRGNSHRSSRLVPEYAIEIMKPLDQVAIDDLAKRQALAGSIDITA